MNRSEDAPPVVDGTTPPGVRALVPAYNEARRIGEVIVGAARFLPVLVVDDGSADDTFDVAEATGATVVRQTPNRGKGEALRTGFRWALAHGDAAVVTLDADGQHDPAEISLFLDTFERDGADLIIGARDFDAIPMTRRLANTIGRWSFSWALREPVRDNQSGYRLISRRLMEATLDSREGGFEFEVEMIVTCHQRGWPITWVPIRTIYADEASHISGLSHALGFSRMVLRTRRATRREGDG